MDFDLLLIQKMKRGDENAFDVFVRKHYEEILKYCCYHCLDASYAEDLTQETFLHFFAKLSDYRYMGKTKNYLYTIAGNLCKDYYKKAKEILLEEPSRDFQNSLQQSETEDILNKITIESALNHLPEELREVIVLYYFQELKLVEISEVLKISLPLVKYRMKQAKIRLEKLLNE
ncbi:MAG: RNA polymerase sigma factor [Lachnospiraceae bacterium]|nr:RNA polymerase sigma factor [Lachnospiraceae bacterium]MDE6980745.1 RNA polymerase sigma factor [Lachnospiraceae bacterium]